MPKTPRFFEQPVEQDRVRAANALELAVEGAVDALQRARPRGVLGPAVAVRAAHQQHHQRRHQRPRQQVRGDHREHHRLGQRHEQEAGDAGEEEHRHEDDADAERRDERRHADLAGADDDRVLERLAEMQMALDVLDRHDRLVDQDADRERQAAERHQVERLAEHLQHQDRGQDRERNRQRDDQRRAPVAEEEQHHHRGQAGGDQRLDDDALHRRLDEHRLVEQRRHLDVGGQDRLHPRQDRAQVGDDVERRRAAVLQHREQHAARAVLADDVGLRREAVAHVGDVAQVGGRAAAGLHRQVVQAGDRLGRAVHAHRVLGRAELGRARRQDQVLQVDRVDDVGRRQPARLQRLHVEVDRDQPVLAAVRERNRDARDRHQLRPQRVDGGVEDASARAASGSTGRAGSPGCSRPST